MRVLILHMRYWPDATGTGPLVTELANDLVAMGEQVTVVTSIPHYGRGAPSATYPGRIFYRSTESGVNVLRTASFGSTLSSPAARALDYWAFTVLATIAGLWSGRPDVILSIAPPFTVGLAGWITQLLKRAPVVFNAQDIWPDGLVSMGRLRSKPLIAVLRAIEKFVYRKADRISVVSEGMKQNIIDKGVRSEKLAVIPNWVDAEFIIPVDKMNPFRASQGLEDRFLVLFAGNVGYAAGLRSVLEAAERVASNPRVFFLIVGEGSAKQELQVYADSLGLENLRFLTTQPRELLPQLLGSADLSLVTLRNGMGSLSVPSKSYAIMASARPMLAAVPEDSAVRDLVLMADCGLWIRPDNPEIMAKTILSLIDQPDRLEAMGQRGRELVEREFARPVGTARYRELLLDLAGQRSHPG